MDIICEKKYCTKCALKHGNINKSVEIFNSVYMIIIKSKNMVDVYNSMNVINIPFNNWIEYDDTGTTIFHYLTWFISTKIKKYHMMKARVYAFFQKVFSDNKICSIFTKEERYIIANLTKKSNNHSLLYDLYNNCENLNDSYYKRLYNLIITNGGRELTETELTEIKKNNIKENILPDKFKLYITDLTTKYKIIETNIITTINNDPNIKLNKCIECGNIIDYIQEIPKIIDFVIKNNNKILFTKILAAYYNRCLLHKIFEGYYKTFPDYSKEDVNNIHKRHLYVINMYNTSLQKYMNFI